jgi:FixJ family two-component response regulator
MKNKITKKLIVVEDDATLRKVIADALTDLGCQVTCFPDGAECANVIAQCDCDLLITDVKMPKMDGLTLLAEIRKIAPWVPVLIMTGFGDIPMSVRAMKLGAVDFIEKPLDRNSFLDKVKSILDKDDLYGSSAGKKLTKTERRVLKLILQGMGNKQIAYTLKRGLRTVELHRSNIMHKFGVDNIVDLVKKGSAIDLTEED